jgi:lipopolysaccharide export system permease protein
VAVILSRYVWSRWIGPLLLTTLAILGILFLETLHGAMPDWLRCGASPHIVLSYHLLLLPGLLPTALPVAVFVASLFALGRLQRNREILAMRAVGLSGWAMVRPLWWSALAIAAALFLLHIFPISWAANRAGAIWAKTHPQIGRHIAYDSHRGRLWIVGELDGAEAKSIFIAESGPNFRHIRADRASFRNGVWTLFGVRERDAAAISSNHQPPFLAEQTYHDFLETPREMLLARRRIRDLSFADLRSILGPIPPNDPDRIFFELPLHSLAAGCCSVLVALLCSLPFTLGSAIHRRTWLAATGAVLCLFIFYLAVNLCQALGTGRILPPVIAAWLPNFLGLTTGLYCLVRRC